MSARLEEGAGLVPVRTRAAIVRAARAWIDTPYRHQASRKGVGCDCLGLVRGVWREFYGEEPEHVPPYTPEWAEQSGAELLCDAARRRLNEINIIDATRGDVLLFRIAAGSPAKHAAIVSAPDRIIHAYWGRAVTETCLTPWWRRRCAFAFSFPELMD